MKLGHGGRAPPDAHRLMRRFLPAFVGTNVGISHQHITGCRAIAREIYGEKKQPGRRVFRPGEKAPTGRDSPKTFAPALVPSSPRCGFLPAFAGANRNVYYQNITGHVRLQEKSSLSLDRCNSAARPKAERRVRRGDQTG